MIGAVAAGAGAAEYWLPAGQRGAGFEPGRGGGAGIDDHDWESVHYGGQAVKSWTRLALLLTLAAAPAWGQFELYLVNGSVVQPVVRTYDFGNVAPGTQAAATFRIVNTSAAPATLNLLTVTGSGFAVSSANAPKLPVSLGTQQSVDFTVAFQEAAPGIYTGALNSVGIAITLTTTVPVQMTYQWVTGQTVQSLAAGPVTFGSVPVGQSPTVQILLLNQTSATLTVPSLAVSGAGFSLAGQPAAGTTVQPSASASFEVQFSSTAAAAFAGTLTIGGQSFLVTGTEVIPPLPLPSIAVALAQSASAQQGTIAVSLSATAQTTASGTVTLSFVPDASIHSPADTGIALSSGGQSTSFNVFIGQKQAAFGTANSIGFQTGTTADTLTVSVTLGGSTVQQSIVILPAVVGVTAVQGVRSTGTVEVDLTGFDNTRSAGAISFTFFDATGNPVAPPVQANAASNFASYFQSAVGGTFVLKAVFPVTGDTSTIASFQATVTNSAGVATTARTKF